MVKNLPANEGDLGLILGWEDPLEKEMATHSSILAWEISWTEELDRLQSLGSQRAGDDLATEHTVRGTKIPHAPGQLSLSAATESNCCKQRSCMQQLRPDTTRKTQRCYSLLYLNEQCWTTLDHGETKLKV